jgi:diguanylate cyclase (GGDEF)-like protein
MTRSQVFDKPGIFSDNLADDLRGRFVDLMDLLSALRQLLGTRDLQASDSELMGRALSALVDHIRLSYCSVFLVDDGKLKCAAGTGFDEELARSMGHPTVTRFEREARQRSNPTPTLPLDTGIMGLAVRTGQQQYCEDCSRDQRFVTLSNHHPSQPHGSLMSLPLKDGEDVMGVMNVWYHVPNYYDLWHRNALALFADALSLILHNARLVRHLDLKVAMRTDALERSLSESQRLRRRFEHLSTVDELTGVFNRRYFFERAGQLVGDAHRAFTPVALVMLDLDNFKGINDTWGHAVGDEVLGRAGRALASELRTGDLLARLGGEEFVVLLTSTPEAEAVELVGRLRAALGQVSAGPVGARRQLTASFGIACNTPDITRLSGEHALDILYTRADKAMHRSKVLGRNRWEVFRDE